VRVVVRDDGTILGHETEGQAPAELQEKGSEGVQGVFHVSWQNKVPHEDSLACREKIIFEGIEEALAGDHFFNGGKRHVRIVPASGQFLGETAIRIFEIRQVDVRVVMGELEQFPGLITGKVEDHGEAVSSSSKLGDEPESMGKEVVRGHEVDVVNTALPDHCFNSFHEPGHLHDLSEAVPGNLMILAKGAAEGAPREEDGPRAPGAGEWRLLAEVRAYVRDPQFGALLAEAHAAAGDAVHTAGPRAKAAILIKVHEIHGMIMQ